MPRNKMNDSPVGSIIMAQLEEMERSQQWLARKANCSGSTVNWIVKGRCKPSVELLGRIADVLSIDVSILIDALSQDGECR